MTMFRLLILCVAVILYPLHSFAEDKAVAETPLTKLEKATADISKGLDENQIKQFAAINNAFTIIRTVEDVQLSIARAVVSCTKANPDIKDPLSNRFETWKEAIRPVIKKANAKLDKMVLMQSFSKPSEVRTYLKIFENAFVYRNQQIKAPAIQKLDECQKLQSSMDGTQDNLVKLISETLALNADLKVKE